MEQNGRAPKSNQDGSDYRPRVLPFDRIRYMEIVCEKQYLSKETQELLKPDNFYDGYYGIIRQQNLPPRKIRIVPSFRRTTTLMKYRCMRARSRYAMLKISPIPTTNSMSVPRAISSRSYCGMAGRS